MKHYQSEERKGLAEEGEWVDQDLAVKAETQMVDAGTGQKLIVRVFDYKFGPQHKKEDILRAKNNKQEFFNSHVKYIKDFLWKDGLSIREDHDPRLMFSKKGDGYRIAVLCESKFGANIFEKATTLQNIFKSVPKKK
jgi:hypothetical protein